MAIYPILRLFLNIIMTIYPENIIFIRPCHIGLRLIRVRKSTKLECLWAVFFMCANIGKN